MRFLKSRLGQGLAVIGITQSGPVYQHLSTRIRGETNED